MTGRPAPVARWLLVVVLGLGLVAMHSLLGPGGGLEGDQHGLGQHGPVAHSRVGPAGAGHGVAGHSVAEPALAGPGLLGHAAAGHADVGHGAAGHAGEEPALAGLALVGPTAAEPGGAGHAPAPRGRHGHHDGSSMLGHGCLAVLGALVMLLAGLLLVLGRASRPLPRRRSGAGGSPVRPRPPPSRPPGRYELCVLRN